LGIEGKNAFEIFGIGRKKIGLFIYINVHTKSALKIDKKKLRSF